jgi:multiple sugar transport system permease protein
MSVASSAPAGPAVGRPDSRPPRRSLRRGRVALHVFLAAVSLLWLFPIVWAVFTSFRSYADTAARGYVSLPGALTLDNYVHAWQDADLPRFLGNTLIVAVPAVVGVVLLGALVAFALTQFRGRRNVSILVLLVAGNLLPPQAIVTPLFRLYLALPLPGFLSDNGVVYDQYVGLIAIHIAFQLGFCVFVLANFMRLLPKELIDAALVDGAGVLRIFREITLPMCRPAIVALATLEFTWIYNDFLWAIVLMRTGDKRPVTSALASLQGEFFTNVNVLAAGAILVALPTIAVYLLLQRHLVRGLALGAPRGGR